MPALAAPTIAQLFTYATSAGDSAGRIGRWTHDTLTNYASNLPTQVNPISLKYNEAVGLLQGLGIDDQALTDLQYALAFDAICCAVCFELLSRDVSGFTLPAEEAKNLEASYSQRMYDFFHRAGYAWRTLGLADDANPYFIYTPLTIGLEAVTPRDLGGFNYNNICIN